MIKKWILYVYKYLNAQKREDMCALQLVDEDISFYIYIFIIDSKQHGLFFSFFPRLINDAYKWFCRLLCLYVWHPLWFFWLCMRCGIAGFLLFGWVARVIKSHVHSAVQFDSVSMMHVIASKRQTPSKIVDQLDELGKYMYYGYGVERSYVNTAVCRQRYLILYFYFLDASRPFVNSFFTNEFLIYVWFWWWSFFWLALKQPIEGTVLDSNYAKKNYGLKKIFGKQKYRL